jgi:uncharacterized protein
MSFRDLGCGVGLRTKHYPFLLEHWPTCDWFEVISENYMVDGGRPLWVLERVRERYPVVMHGVSLSIGSTDPLDSAHLARLRRLAERIEPEWISDHLCWTGVGGRNAHDLLPLPHTEEALAHVVERVLQVEDALGRPLVLENVSSYVSFRDSTMTEAEFLGELARRADCYLLLDVNNVYVSAFNHGFDARGYLDAIPIERVVQFHLAGHTDHGTHLVDTHDHPVIEPVWALYAEAVRRFGPRSTLIERDEHIPEFPDVAAEAEHARAIRQGVHAESRRHAEALLGTDQRA